MRISTGSGCRGVLLSLTTVMVCAGACTGNVGSSPTGAGTGTGTGTGGTGTSGTAGSNGSGSSSGTAGTGNPVTGTGGTGTMITGAGGTGSGTTGAGGSIPTTLSGLSCATVGADTAGSVLRRLSNLEYQLTVQDLFQLTAPPAVDGIPPDVDKDGFRTFASLQSVSAQHLRAYTDRAHQLADELMADTARRTRVLGCEVTAANCLRTFVTRFGKLAYRRPLETAEVDALVTRATADALDATDQFRFVIEVMLSSSSFLYRVEVGSTADALATLTPHELASRLSFTLWGRGPDNALLDQAAAGGLATADGLATVTNTMLADPRAQLFYEAFFRQWLGFEAMGPPPNPPAGWSNALVADMTRETQLVVNDFAWGNRNLLDMLTANYTRPTTALSSYFGIPAAAADGTATFPAGHVRANTGILTHPSVLAAKRDGDLIAIRGNWLRRTFLCRGLTIPANVAEDLGDILVGLTRVQIVQKRNTEGACMGCHAQIDPVGLGFVQFDHTGRFDATINATEYGIATALPDAGPNGGFSSIGQLATMVRNVPQVTACLATKVFTYAAGREPERADTCAIEAASTSFIGNGNNFSAMLKGLVASPTFRLRRAPAVTP